MASQQQKILVTGATGFIGLELCRVLFASAYGLRVLIRESSDIGTLQQVSADIDFVKGDLSDEKSLQSACEGVDYVIHLAGISHVNNVPNQEYQEVIVEGSARLFSAAVLKDVTRIVFLSSSLAGFAEEGVITATSYGSAKLYAENQLRQICQGTKTDYLILRPVNVYGPGMKGNLNNMISWIKKGIMPPLPKVETKLSLVSVNDLTALIVSALSQNNISGKSYLISEREEYKLLDIEDTIYQSLGKKIPAWRTPRMVLFVAAGLAGLISRLLRIIGIRTAFEGIGLRTYQNLVADNIQISKEDSTGLIFNPKDNFYEMLPSIIEAKFRQQA